MGKGSSSPSTTRSEVVQSNLPEYARPYYEDLLGRTTYESTRPYTPYPGPKNGLF